MMRRGMTLVEILIVVMVLPFAMLAFDVLFRSALSDIPRSTMLVQENTSLLSMLEQMRQDIGAAKALPESLSLIHIPSPRDRTRSRMPSSA